jgi:hypothetical protein
MRKQFLQPNNIEKLEQFNKSTFFEVENERKIQRESVIIIVVLKKVINFLVNRRFFFFTFN